MRKEIEKTKQVIHNLRNLQHGVVKDPLLSILREVGAYIYIMISIYWFVSAMLV